MASTESSTSLHATTTTPEEPIGRKVIEEVKAMEQETVALSKEVIEEENPNTEELPSEANQISKSEEEAEVKQTEPPAVEVKIEHDSILDIPGKDPIPHSQEQTDPELIAEAVNGKIVVQPTTESIAEVLEQPGEVSVEETQHEQPKINDAPEPSSVEVVEKPKEFSDILPAKESEEVLVKDLEDSEAVSKEVEKQESQVLEVDVKQEEESKVAEQVEKSESVEEVGKVQEPLEVQPVKESEDAVKDVEVPVAASKDIHELKSVVPEVEEKPKEQSEVTEAVVVAPEVVAKQKGQSEVAEQIEPESVVPEVEAKPKEQVEPESVFPEGEEKPKERSEVTEQVEPPVVPEVEEKPKEQSEVTEQVEPVEATEKQQEYSEVRPVKESEAAGVKDMKVLVDLFKPKAAVKPEEQSVVAEEADKTKLLDPEVDEKPEEHSEAVVEKVENPKLLDPEVQGKPKEESEVAEEVVELKSTDEKPEAVEPAIEVKPDGKTEVRETLIDEGPVADKLEETTYIKGEKTSKEEEPSAAYLPDVTEKAAVENGKKEADVTAVGEMLLSKEAEVEKEKGGEEKEEITIKSEGKTVDRDVLNEELVQPSKVDDVKNAVSSAEAIERSFDKEITEKGVEPIVENKIVNNIKVDKPALVETSKDASAEDVKLDEIPTTVDESVQESQGSGSEVKEEQNTKTDEDKLEKENVEEMSKSNVQVLEPSGDDVKSSLDMPTEVPAKSAHKQSNNILTKVKQSLVKAKKAIIGKSPSSKTLASDTKGDIKVK